jgi:hypothetical protein
MFRHLYPFSQQSHQSGPYARQLQKSYVHL